MPDLRGVAAVVSVVGVIVAIAACAEEDFKDCYGEDLIACTCAGGAEGYAKCGPSGDYASSSCVCDGTTPGIDASTSAAPDAGIPCTSDADCPNGCNMRGVCRNP